MGLPARAAALAAPVLALALAAAAAAAANSALCEDPTVDAAFHTDDGDAYIFKGDLYYRLRAGGGVANGYPRRVSERWPALPAGGVDAAFALRDGRTYFFKGPLFWRLAADGRLDGRSYPRPIQRFFPGLPARVDAAVLAPDNARYLFFSGPLFWEVDARRERRPVIGPRNVSCWGARAPPSVDAAVVLEGRLYLFSGALHVRLDERLCQVEDAEPPYPRDNARWLFGCEVSRARQTPPSESLVVGVPAAPVPPAGPAPPSPAAGGRGRGRKIPGAGAGRKTPSATSPPQPAGPETPPAPNRNAPPELCLNPRPDALIADGSSSGFFFVRGARVWRVGAEGASGRGWPQRAAALWPGLPAGARVSAAYRAADGSAFVFTGRRVWRFATPAAGAPPGAAWRPLAGFPTAIASAFPGAPDAPDAVLAWPGDKVFFFKGSLFWKYDPSRSPPVDPMYPNVVEHWAGIPGDGVDAAAVLANRTFFFKGPHFYRFDDRAFAVEAAHPPFPRLTAHWWLRCPPEATIATSTAPPTTPAPTTPPTPSTAAPAAATAPAPRATPPAARDCASRALASRPVGAPLSPRSAPPDACGGAWAGAPDAVLSDGAGGALALRGAWAWRLAGGRVARGWPRPLSALWPGLPADVDAATLDAAGNALFFKGALYWRYAPPPSAQAGAWRLERSFPHAVCLDWPGVPDAPDAALLWGARRHFFFFKGSLFWKYDPSRSPPVDPMYPNVVEHWAGIPGDGVDAAAVLGNRTFFFKGPHFYRFDDRAFALAAEDPPYPHLTAERWFGCRRRLP